MCQIGSDCSCDSGGKITSPLGRQRGENVQPESGLKSQDRAEQCVVYRREGRDGMAEAEHESVGLNHDLKIRGCCSLVSFVR